MFSFRACRSISSRGETLRGPSVVLAVECKDQKKAVGASRVAEYIARVVAQQTSRRVTGGALVSRVDLRQMLESLRVNNPLFRCSRSRRCVCRSWRRDGVSSMSPRW
jgi:hypothetical protein